MKGDTYRKGYQRLLDFTQQKGLKVVLKSRHVLKDYIGMNPLAARELGFKMPDNQIWILRTSKLPTKYHTLKHELTEMKYMEQGMAYFPAHEQALRNEGLNGNLPKELQPPGQASSSPDMEELTGIVPEKPVEKPITTEQAEHYYKKQEIVDATIKQALRHDDDEIVYGARSVNAHMPDYLTRFTEDWDIYSKDAAGTAKEIEKDLDKHFGGNYFEVKPAVHRGTFKVVSRVTRRNVADITAPENKIRYHKIRGIKYTTLDEEVEKLKQILASPENAFRHAKDTETLQRIEILRRSTMPSKTEKQRRFMGADLARLRAGEPTKTGMSETQLEEFAEKPGIAHGKEEMAEIGKQAKKNGLKIKAHYHGKVEGKPFYSYSMEASTLKQAKTLNAIGKHTVVQRHDDGDLTIKARGKLQVVTTNGQRFTKTKTPKARMPGRLPSISRKRGRIYHTKTRRGDLLSRTPIRGR